jgi:hypothetical protein
LISNCIYTVDSSSLSSQADQESLKAFSDEANPSICLYQDFAKQDNFHFWKICHPLIRPEKFIISSWINDFPEVDSAEWEQFKIFEENGTRLAWAKLSATFYFTCMID